MPVNTLPPDPTDPGYGTGREDVTAEPSVTTASMGRPVKPLERGEPLGRYIILRTLGEGGMGIVYSAYDPELDRRVAIKLLRPSGNASPERQMRLMREAQALARISHPNVIAVYDVGTHNENVFVAMELVESGTLTDWLEEKKRGVREIIAMFVDAGKGLGAAHAAGMIHRDFKPENVLVGKDGRCRVTDFGLARLTTSGEHEPIGEADQRPTDTGKPINQRLTRAGAVVGTPLFMSWEQFQGKAADQRSDQYNYCASLYWALFGAPPPGPYTAGDSRDSTAETVVTAGGTWTPQRLRDLPKEPRLPAPVRRAILRGLSLKPEDRFSTMEDLLRELGKDPRAAQRRGILAGVGVLALGLLAMTYVPILKQQQQLCRGAERKLEGIWTPEIHAQASKAFADTGALFAADSSERAAAALDQYTSAWVAMHQEACEATRIRGEQSDQVLDLRMICLDRRLQQVSALAKLFLTPDVRVVEKSLDAVNALPPVANCADIAALTSPVPRPESPEERDPLARIERSIAEARALMDSAHYRQALELIDSLIVESEKHPWPPVHAELLNIKGLLILVKGDAGGAEKLLREALLWAERGRAENEKVSALMRLAVVTGFSANRFDEALYWGQLAEAAASRGNDPLRKVELATRVGQVYLNKGDYEAARATLERAAILGESTLGREHYNMSIVLQLLAEAYGKTGDHQKALQLLQTSLEISEKARGKSHPNIGFIHRALGVVLYRLGSYERAHEHIQAAIKLWTDAYGPEHPDVAMARDDLATVLQLDGLYAESLVEANKALAIKKKVLPKNSIHLSYSLGNVGQALLGLKRYLEALPPLEEAEKMQEEAKFSAEEIAEVRFAYARALWETKKDKNRALVLAAQARDGFRRGHDRRAEDQADRWLGAHGAGHAASRP